MDDQDVLTRIDELVEEEHRLRAVGQGSGLSAEERARLQNLEERLDQCWDLLRRRRGREEFHQDPNSEQPRPIDEVESYRQ